MFRRSLTRLGVVVGGVALSLTAAAGIGSAEPDLSPAVNMTCSYPQVMAALNAQSPEAAARLNASPQAQSMLQSFIAAPPAKRQHMIERLQRSPQAQQYADKYVGLVLQVVDSCNNY
jgi:hemophore-related protein